MDLIPLSDLISNSDTVLPFIIGFHRRLIPKPLRNAVDSVLDVAGDILGGIADFIGDLVGGFLSSAWSALSTAIKNLWQNIGLPIVEFILDKVFGITDEEIFLTQSTTVQIVEDTDQNSIVLAVVRAIRREESLTEHIKAAIIAGPPNSLNVYSKLGLLKYVHKLPTVEGAYKAIKEDVIEQALEAVLGIDITVITAIYGEYDEDIWITTQLLQLYDYDPDTKIISNLGGVSWKVIQWIENGEAPIVSAYHWAVYITLDPATQVDPGTVNNPQVLFISPPSGSNYYSILYQNVATLEKTYLIYQVGTGTYPLLDSQDTVNEYFKDYFEIEMYPVVVLRKNFVNVDKLDDKTEYLTGKSLLRTITVDMDQLISSLVNEDNPSELENVRDAFMHFGLNIYSEVLAVKRALFIFFNALANRSEVKEADYLSAIPGNPKFNTFSIKEQNYNTTIVYNYISQTNIDGSIGAIGDVTTEVVILPPTPIEDGGGLNSYFIMNFQLDTKTYRQLKIHGLALFVLLRTTVGSLQHTTIELNNGTTEEDINTQKNFIIPLCNIIVQSNTLSFYEKEVIIREAMIMTIYSADYQYLRFYQTKRFGNLFKIVLQAIAFLVLVFSVGTAKELSTWLWLLAKAIATNYAISYVIRRAIEIAGDNDYAKLLILAAVAYGFYEYGVTTFELATAEALVLAVTATLPFVVYAIALEGESITDEIKAINQDFDEREEELEKLESTLNNDTGLNFWELATYAPIDIYESPNDYYERTIHSTNPGVFSLVQIENFHENLLRLPELDTQSFAKESVYT